VPGALDASLPAVVACLDAALKAAACLDAALPAAAAAIEAATLETVEIPSVYLEAAEKSLGASRDTGTKWSRSGREGVLCKSTMTRWG
jgi:hypothetical protein